METAALEWTVMTWNIQGIEPTDLDRVAAAIEREAPDVVALQEVRRPQAAALAVALDMMTVWVFKHNPLFPFFSSRAEGAAILTPHSITAQASERVSTARSKHSYRRRVLQWATIERADASAYQVYNTHLSPGDLANERRDEAARITSIVTANGDAPPPVIAGDLNDEGEPEIIAALPGIEHVPPPPTNPSDRPTQVLDHVLLPCPARNVAVTVPAGGDDWATLSDHLPLTVRFTLDWVQGGVAG